MRRFVPFSIIFTFCLFIGVWGCAYKNAKPFDPSFLFLDSEKLQNCGYGLIFFFSKHNCPPCMDVVLKLNEMANNIPIIGVLDQQDSGDIESIRRDYAFPVEIMREKYLNYLPFLSPCLVAVDQQGRVLMVLPGLRGQEEYFEQIALELAAKAISL